MKMNNITLAKRIRAEQEIVYRPYNIDVYLDNTDTEVTIDKDGVKHYPYDPRLEYAQGLNSNKSNKPIHKRHPKLVDTSNKPLPEYLYVADRSLTL